MARGHVRQRGKGWSYVIHHEALDKPEWSRQQPTKADAERLMTARLAELDRGVGVALAKETVSVYVRAWLKGRKRITTATRLNYQAEIEKRIIPYLGTIKLARLKPEQVAVWHRDLKDAGESDAAILMAHTVLSMALKQAHVWGHVAQNVAALVERPVKPTAREYVWWEPDEARQFLAATAESDDAALYRLALAGLLRRGELLALLWEDVDLGRRRIVVRRTITKSALPGVTWEIGIPKGKRSRIVTIDAETVAALRHHKEQQAFRRARSTQWIEHGLVFPNRDGKIEHQQVVRDRFIRATKDAGVRAIRFHDLRHTGATLLLRGGVSIKVVSDMLGHANVSITSSVYLHVSESMQDDAADVMGRMLGGS
jgi:integrase